MDYENISFQSPDGLALMGWWIQAQKQSRPDGISPAVILLHPLLGNRHGLKVQGQGWLRLINQEVDLLKTADAFH